MLSLPGMRVLGVQSLKTLATKGKKEKALGWVSMLNKRVLIFFLRVLIFILILYVPIALFHECSHYLGGFIFGNAVSIEWDYLVEPQAIIHDHGIQIPWHEYYLFHILPYITSLLLILAAYILLRFHKRDWAIAFLVWPILLTFASLNPKEDMALAINSLRGSEHFVIFFLLTVAIILLNIILPIVMLCTMRSKQNITQ